MAKQKATDQTETPAVAILPLEAGMSVRWAVDHNGPWCGAFVRRVNGDGTLSLTVFTPNGSTGNYTSVPHKDKLEESVGRPFAGCWDYTDTHRAIQALMNRVDALEEVVTT